MFTSSGILHHAFLRVFVNIEMNSRISTWQFSLRVKAIRASTMADAKHEATHSSAYVRPDLRDASVNVSWTTLENIA